MHLTDVCMMLITIHTGESADAMPFLHFSGKLGGNRSISDLGNLQGILPKQCPQTVPPPNMSLPFVLSMRLCMSCMNKQEQLASDCHIAHAALV